MYGDPEILPHSGRVPIAQPVGCGMAESHIGPIGLKLTEAVAGQLLWINCVKHLLIKALTRYLLIGLYVPDQLPHNLTVDQHMFGDK